MSNSRPHDDGSEMIARLRRSFDDGLAGHAVAAPDGRLLACNLEFARIIGFDSVDDAMTANLNELEPQPGAFLPLVQRLAESPLIPLEELRFIRRDGTHAQVLARLAATNDADGNVTEIRVYLVDISQRFSEEQRLRAVAERLQLAAYATQDVVWDWDVASGLIEWSGATARRFRYSDDEIRSAFNWHASRIHEEDRERVLRGLERATRGGDAVWSDEYRLLRGDGIYATVLDRAHIVRDSHGETVRVVGSIFDITELRANEAAQRFLADASVALETALDTDAAAEAVVRTVVPRFADMCLIDLIQPDGSLRRVAVAHSDVRLETELRPGLVASDGSPTDFVPLLTTRTGELDCTAGSHPSRSLRRRLAVSDSVDVHACVVVPITARDNPVGAVTFGFSSPRHFFDPLFIMTARDLAGRAGIAINNAQLYEAARRAVRSRNDVLGIVSHDLRVPLHSIMASLSLLSESMPEERRADARKLIDILKRATRQMDRLIEDLLDMSRIEAGQFRIDREECNIKAIVNEACDALRPIAAPKDIEIAAELDQKLPGIAVDAPKIVRVLGNLLGNAIKFSPQNTRVVIRAAAGDGELRVSVHDDGPGIPPEQVTRVFDQFWQARPSDGRGAGLGLAISRGIVEAHGGRIWVDTNSNSGSTFTFVLPINKVSRARRSWNRAAKSDAGPNARASHEERPDSRRLSEKDPPRTPREPGREASSA